ncbi:probable RNA-binding protein EIF1AD [Patella vulgata]|uniref:probable RNA-binding protein EIF1AD n=1 Tax=Patella vulgata TaxID=6465 RepID=UPI002180432D|nr:probable RNA-binding protein EIF1AD [Patella vulgata]
MSKATKKKHVTKEVLDDFVLPEENEFIVKVTAGRGNNLHEVQNATGEKFLVSMPTKFRKNVWIKRGDFIIVNPIEEGDRVKAEIVTILYKDQIKYIKQEGKWPEQFNEEENEDLKDDMLPPSDSGDSDDEIGDMVRNVNRPQVYYEEDESDSDEDSEKEDG